MVFRRFRGWLITQVWPLAWPYYYILALIENNSLVKYGKLAIYDIVLYVRTSSMHHKDHVQVIDSPVVRRYELMLLLHPFVNRSSWTILESTPPKFRTNYYVVYQHWQTWMCFASMSALKSIGLKTPAQYTGRHADRHVTHAHSYVRSAQ